MRLGKHIFRVHSIGKHISMMYLLWLGGLEDEWGGAPEGVGLALVAQVLAVALVLQICHRQSRPSACEFLCDTWATHWTYFRRFPPAYSGSYSGISLHCILCLAHLSRRRRGHRGRQVVAPPVQPYTAAPPDPPAQSLPRPIPRRRKQMSGCH